MDEYGFFSACQISPSNFTIAGKYRIRFVYSTKSVKIGGWAGRDVERVANNDMIRAMFKHVPKVAVQSNEIEITVDVRGK